MAEARKTKAIFTEDPLNGVQMNFFSVRAWSPPTSCPALCFSCGEPSCSGSVRRGEARTSRRGWVRHLGLAAAAPAAGTLVDCKKKPAPIWSREGLRAADRPSFDRGTATTFWAAGVRVFSVMDIVCTAAPSGPPIFCNSNIHTDLHHHHSAWNMHP